MAATTRGSAHLNAAAAVKTDNRRLLQPYTMAAGFHVSDLERLPAVVTTRVPAGRIVSAPDYDVPVVVASDQQDNKARILLTLSLTRTAEISGIQRFFDTC